LYNCPAGGNLKEKKGAVVAALAFLFCYGISVVRGKRKTAEEKGRKKGETVTVNGLFFRHTPAGGKKEGKKGTGEERRKTVISLTLSQ